MKLFGSKQSPPDTPRRRQYTADSTDQSSNQGSRQSVQFRRGRTLTGSVSPNIKSSSEESATMMSPRAHIHHLSRKRRSIGVRLVVIAVLLVGIYLLVSQLVATVDVRASDQATIAQAKLAEYDTSLQQYYDKYPSQRFYPSLNSAQLTQFMQLTHPEIASATVALTGSFGHGQLSVAVRKPIVRWTIGGKNEFVDASGIVFETNGYQTPAVRIVDKTGVSTDQGVVTSRRFLSFVGSVVGDMSARGFAVTEAAIPPLTTRQLQISVKRLSYPIKLTIDRSAGEQTEDAARVIRYLKQQGIKPSYIDVRIKGKAFYK